MMSNEYFARSEIEYRAERVRKDIRSAREQRRAARRRRFGPAADR
jgi:hypothetical protein